MIKSVRLALPTARVVSISSKIGLDHSVRGDRLILSTTEGLAVIPYEEIVYFESDGNYVFIHLLCGKRLMTSRSLAWIQSQYKEGIFFQVHQKFIVNLSGIRFIEVDSVSMVAGQKIPLARRRRKELMALFTCLV